MKKVFFSIIIIISIASCTPQLVPYTSSIQRQSGLSVNDLNKVQFYNSDRIVLFREVGKSTSEVISGDIKIVDGKQIEEIVINPMTPGIMVNAAGDQRFGISFEDGADRYLVFGLDPKKAGRYTIYGKNWKNHQATIDYDGKEYRLAPHSSETILLVNLKKLNGTKVSSRTVKGRAIK